MQGINNIQGIKNRDTKHTQNKFTKDSKKREIKIFLIMMINRKSIYSNLFIF